MIGIDASEVFFSNVVGLALLGKNMQETNINLLTQYRYSDDTTQKDKLALRDIRSWSDLEYVVYYYFDVVRDTVLPFVTTFKQRVSPASIKLFMVSVFVIAALTFLTWVVRSYT